MRLSTILALSPWLATAINIDFSSTDSIKSGLSYIAHDMTNYYQGNLTGQVPGLLPGGLACNPQNPGVYCWWEAGAMFGALINYWQYTGDTSYNDVIIQALLFQKGPNNNYNPPNQTKSMGIDDQDFWGFSALDAVEANFPAPGGDNPSWLALAQAVYNFQMSYWDTSTCGGGFHWQVFSANAGYNLKNTVSNGGNFLLAARLAFVTGNDSYAKWAEQVYDWTSQSVLFQEGNDGILYIWDNTDTNNNCADVTHYIWSYNYGLMLAGSAYMYNYTGGSSLWEGRVNQILDSTFKLFFPSKYGGNIMFEYQCDEQLNCNQDQKSFKAYLSRWLATTALLVPNTWGQIMPKLQASAKAAAAQCSGEGANTCGMQWWSSTWDGSKGVGQEMTALSVIGTTLITSNMAPLSLATGANSTSDPNAGVNHASNPLDLLAPITTADRAGAGILTILGVVLVVSGSVWIIL